MSKMFYTLSEAAQKLGKSEATVLSMSEKGLIQKNMHEGQVKFRVEQIDLLAGDEPALGNSGAPIGLADTGSGAPINVSPSKPSSSLLEESAIGLADSAGASGAGKRSLANDDSGISIFAGGKSGSQGGGELGLEAVGSGSGLLDLTRESEETALGAELIEGVYGSDGANDLPPPGASGIFEPVGGGGSFSGAGNQGGSPFPVAVEIYDGGWSGVGIGLMAAAVIALVCVAVSAIALTTGGSSQLATFFAEGMLVWVGGLAGVTAVFGVLGFFLGRATE